MTEIMICDSHIHLGSLTPVDESVSGLKKIIDDYDYEKIMLHPLPSHGYGENFEALYCKALLLPKVYASMGLCHNFSNEDTDDYYLEEIKRYYAMGCDGIKFLEGLPNYYNTVGRRLDDKVYDKLFAFCEENGITVTMHVGYRQMFWECENLNEELKKIGWSYAPRDLSLEMLRSEAFGILKKFPKLKMIFAHFNFMSYEPDRVIECFEKWPNLYLDVTPGIEMYKGFTKNYEKSKAIFEKYSDRILYGTDASSDYSEHSWTRKALNIVRPFMEGKEEYTEPKIGNAHLKPFGFGEDILRKIYRDNFIHIYGETPRPLDYELIGASITGFVEKFRLEPVECENLKCIESYFKSKR